MKNGENMKKAHEMTKKAIARNPVCYGLMEDGQTSTQTSYSATLSEALRIVSAEPGDLTRADFWMLDGNDQINALRAMVGYAKRTDGTRTTADGRPIPPVMDWTRNPGDLDSIANEAYCIMAEQEETADPETPLALALYRAVTLAAVRIMRETVQHGTTRRPDKHAASGESIDARRVAERTTDPEHASIIRDALERCAADDLDRAIMDCIGYGLTKAETAAALKVNKNTVTARMRKATARFEEWKRA